PFLSHYPPSLLLFFCLLRPPPTSTLFPYTTLFRSAERLGLIDHDAFAFVWVVDAPMFEPAADAVASGDVAVGGGAWTAVHHAFRSEEHTSELQSRFDLVCRLLLEKKKETDVMKTQG